jgi:hypothetical protein
MTETKNTYFSFDRNPDRKKQHEMSIRSWEDNTKVNLKGMRWERGHWIHDLESGPILALNKHNLKVPMVY